MWIKQITAPFIQTAYCIFNLTVIIAESFNLTTYFLMRSTIQIKDSFEITWSSYIHSICNGLHRWSRLILPCIQEFKEHIIKVICCNKSFNRQSHLFCKQPRSQVSQVSTGYRKDSFCRIKDFS